MTVFFRTLSALAAIASVALALPSSAPQPEKRAIPGFGQRAIFTPPSNYRTPKVLYPRSTFLADGKTLLATWENYSPEPPQVYFPIYRSTDYGASWTSISTVKDTVNGWGLRYQPFLYTLPQAFAGYPAGTVLLAGNSIPSDLSQTRIDLYASTDSGVTWKFVSHIASGGRAEPNNGETPVWEPFILLYNNQLHVYYSDQRDPAHGQKMVHQSSSNMVNWGGVVDDVAYPTYSDRPGMPVIAQLPNNQWIYVYEYGGKGGFSIYYKIGPDPTKFGSVTGVQLVSSDGTKPVSSPYVVWGPSGGANGTIVVSSGTNAPVYINKQLGNAKGWTTVEVPIAKGYSGEVKFLDKVGSLMVLRAGPLGGNNYVSNAILTIS